jgi:hypothetical protein
MVRTDVRRWDCTLLPIAALAALAVGSLASTGLAAERVSVDYSFDRPEVSEVMIAGQSYHRLSMPECPNGGQPGQPALPECGARVLIPFGTKVSDVQVIAGERVSLGAGYYVEPVSRPVPLSAGPGAAVPPTPDPSIYASDQPFPGELFAEIGPQSFRGYQMLVLRLQPVQYVPSSGELSYFSRLTVVVDTVVADGAAPLYRGLPEDAWEAAGKVDNPELVQTYAAAGQRGEKGFDLLILTTDSLASAFQPLKDYHDANGLPTMIHTTTDVGSNDPDDVRDYIRDRYNNDGISYVIIGGDDDVIPAKNLYVDSQAGSVEYAMPGDIYFACLDGTWNYDGDSYWGEPTDGENGGDVDLFAEVYIGRACGGNTTEINRFVDKTLWYFNDGHTQVENVLLVGEYLGFGGVSEYAAWTLEQLIDGCVNCDGYTTVGIPSDQYVIDTLFERDMSWTQAHLVTRINNGLHLLNHLGHGDTGYAMKLYNSDIMSDLNNTDLCFVYSQTCLAGHFDGTDCWAEYMHIKTDSGGFAVIMNARYGWGQYNSTDGPSQWFNRQFWDAVYGEGLMEAGPANQDSKEDNIHRINEPCGRWCYYELNLFGDPTLAFRGVAAIGFEYPGGIPETVLPGQPTTIEVVVNPIGDGVPVADSGQLHYSIDGGAYMAVDMTETSPNHYEATLPALACGSTIDFYFTAEEATNGTFSDPRDAPATTYSAFPVTEIVEIFADDFETNQGWTVENSPGLTDGSWERGVPVGGGDRGDPATDYDGSGKCYLTDNEDGNSDVDDGYTWLISPTFDLSGGDAEVHYALWYTNNFGADPNNDLFKTYVSNDNGASWVLAETIGPQTSAGWNEHTFMVGDFVTPNARVKVRFEASDLHDGSVVEAGIDDFSVLRYICEDVCFGDLDGDNDVDLNDLSLLLSHYGMTSGAEYEHGDLDGDGDVDLNDLSQLLAVYGTSCP